MNPTLNAADISSMNVNRLKQELGRRGLPTHGLTPILAERLQQAIGNPPLAQQLASTTMIPEMYDMLAAATLSPSGCGSMRVLTSKTPTRTG